MCCLTYENKTYRSLKAKFPRIGKKVNTTNGKGKVVRHNAICNRVTIRLDEGTEVETEIEKIINEKE